MSGSLSCFYGLIKSYCFHEAPNYLGKPEELQPIHSSVEDYAQIAPFDFVLGVKSPEWKPSVKAKVLHLPEYHVVIEAYSEHKETYCHQ